MPFLLILLLALALLAAGPVTGGAGTAPAAAAGTAAASPLFVTADRCVACHNQLTAPDGSDVSIGSDWRGSMMAHSARDPYWQASVRRETLDHPSVAAAIENECAACHMPMDRFQATAAGQLGSVFPHLPVGQTAAPASLLALDGVSCSVCHQIQPDRLGTPESFTAGFVVDTTRPLGDRQAFGPYDVDAGRERVMSSASQLRPASSAHIQSSELCATCHTLYTHAFGPGGEVIGELPEQVPYLEWKHSDYADAMSCQSCHMPVVAGETAIAGVTGQPRSEFSRHVFRGGNFFMPRILNRYRNELGVAALPQELEATSRRTADNLQTDAARVTVERVELGGGRLRAEILVENLAGHKLPTAYPSRRAWLHVTVKDRGGKLLFESGAFTREGAIAGNDNDADPARYEPHYREIDRADQVQIYEPILGGRDGRVTTGLLTAVRYLKDNRILPLGFDKATAGPDIAVQGAAAEDADFTGGSDRVRYLVTVEETQGPFTVEAELWYQPIGFRWAENLRAVDSRETHRFVGYYAALSEASGIVLARGRGVSVSAD